VSKIEGPNAIDFKWFSVVLGFLESVYDVETLVSIIICKTRKISNQRRVVSFSLIKVSGVRSRVSRFLGIKSFKNKGFRVSSLLGFRISRF
jgi:hypothetical protein